MNIIFTQGRKALPDRQWVTPELSQGTSNCVATRRTGNHVQMDDTKNPGAATLGIDARAWGATIAALK